jgi:hypothetical protein
MGSRYLFIILYCLIEEWLCAQDYRSGGQTGNETLHN